MSKWLLLLLWSGGILRAADVFPEIPPYLLAPARMIADDGADSANERLFRTTSLRRRMDLGGWWDFAADPDDAGERARFYSRFPQVETRLWVPDTWNSQARYWQYTGPAWYRRGFELPETGNLRLRFGSVFYKAKVWLDGEYLGEHEGGYLPFEFLIRNARKGSHTLVVRADNRLDNETLPKRNVDWFPYGGIERPVVAELVPDIWLSACHFVPEEVAPGRFRLRVKLAIRNLGAAARSKVTLALDGREVHAGAIDIPEGRAAAEFEVPLPEPRLWSPEHPNLYSARIVLGDRDDQFARFGVRTLRAEGGRILLNGKPFKLRGVNRHEDHPDWGSALPPHLVRQDIEIIKRLGANAVRAHYPLNEMFMDYCDQNGLVFMSEVPSWQYSPQQLADPRIQDKIKRFFSAMVDRDLNHPSVLTWSLGNEWPKPDESYDIVKTLVEYARGVDGSHLITFITGGPSVWRVHELLDVICVNWAQYQWYDPITYLDRKEGEKSIADLARIHERYPSKPVILTEFGGAESQAGWHNWGNVKWSEEYQARNVADSGRHALEQNWISGGCVWQFCDSRSAPERILAGRLHGWNTKGVVDGYRNPKMAFYSLQQLFKSLADLD